MLFDDVAGQFVGFPRGGAVTDGNQLGLMFLRQFGDQGNGFVPAPLGFMRINGGRIQEFAGIVNHGHFYAGANSRVQTDGGFMAGGCCQQQILKIAGEYLNGFGFCSLSQLPLEFQIQMRG